MGDRVEYTQDHLDRARIGATTQAEYHKLPLHIPEVDAYFEYTIRMFALADAAETHVYNALHALSFRQNDNIKKIKELEEIIENQKKVIKELRSNLSQYSEIMSDVHELQMLS